MSNPTNDIAAWSTRFAALDPYLNRPLVPVDVLKYVLSIADDSHEAFRRVGLRVVTFGRASFISVPQLLSVFATWPVSLPSDLPSDAPPPVAEPVDHSPRPDPAAEFWTRKEVAAYLRVSVDFVENSADLNRMIVRQGRKVLYRSRSVVQWASRKA